ncbi:alpha/beta hydrolase [Azohydromonas caseinilytica]|uniref:Permease n=1 Tax=Azohydromonas caseinilytica TaxID=2728836 RepID=A0A848F7L3_9BURK|nr:alpha/beta hydrolase [Azohydromonas caseinilytica]NML15352.1 permease [Azohydromonas caseinilytica]
MIARLLQFTTGLWLASVLGWLGWAFSRGRPLTAVLGALLLLSLHAVVLGLELLLHRHVSRHDGVTPAPLRALSRAWWTECVTGVRVFCWRQPFRYRSESDFLPPAGTSSGVLLIHGLVCNRGVWNSWLRTLRQRGIPVLAPSVEPPFGRIDTWVPTIDAAVRRLHAHTGGPVLIVAHSLGGIAVRAWLRQGGDAALVQRVFTIGSPHRGTWLARFGWSPNARQLRLDSPWLQALARHEAKTTPRVPFTCFFSDCDNVVFPPSVATLPGADNRLLRGWAHVDLLDAPEILETVLQCAAAPSPVPHADWRTGTASKP